MDPSCSSGRQSRTYFGWWIFDDPIPLYFQYFNSTYIRGLSYADFCPVAQNYYYEAVNDNFIGRCDIGSGNYGSKIYYEGNVNYTSKELESITGETYSNTSFCYLSSLTRESEKIATYILKL